MIFWGLARNDKIGKPGVIPRAWISLSDGSNSVFDTHSTTINGTPLAGVGHKAVRTREGGAKAVKRDRICDIFVKPPAENNDAMAKQLGEVCNKLFELP
jgi:hypothetical protein